MKSDTEKLPDLCYSLMPSTSELIIIKQGESGYYHCDYSTSDAQANRRLADELNGRMRINKAQEVAMLHGSMFGWQIPAANPDNYDENGELVRSENYATESENDFSTESGNLANYDNELEDEYDEEI